MKTILIKESVFRKLLLSYIFILVIPLIAGFIVYQISVYNMERNARNNSLNLLEQTKTTVDRNNMELENFVYQLSENIIIRELMDKKSMDDVDVGYDLYRVRKLLSPYTFANPFYRDFYLYFPTLDVIVSPESSYVRPFDYYRLHPYLGESKEKWHEEINLAQHSRSYISKRDKKESKILYVQSLPLLHNGNPRANVITIIDEEDIISLLNNIVDQYGGASFIYDKGGEVIVKNQLDPEMIQYDSSTEKYEIKNNHSYFLFETKSEQNGWTYAAIISKSKLSKDVQFIKLIHYSLAALTLLFGIYFAFIFSYKHSVPLQRLLALVKGVEMKKIKNPYDFLHSNMEEMLATNDSLQVEMEKQLPILQDSIIKKLVNGEFTSSNEAITLIEQADIPLKGAYGYVGIIKINHVINRFDHELLEDMNAAQIIIKQEINRLFTEEIIQSNIETNQIAILFTFYQKPTFYDENNIKAKLEQLIDHLDNRYRLHVIIGLGRPFEKFMDITESYEEAKISLPLIHSVDQQAKLFQYNPLHLSDETRLHYPLELEVRITNAVISGELEDVEVLFGKIIAENIDTRLLTQKEAVQLVALLHGTIVRILSKKTLLKPFMVEEFYDELERVKTCSIDFQEELNIIKEILLRITQFIYEGNTIGEQQSILKVQNWVKEHFSDSNITMEYIVEQVKIPEKIIQLLFKEHMGLTLADYIENIRMTHAKTMLRSLDVPIEEIAISSGYNSAHSFRRAFKRHTGISPSAYRKMIKDK